MEYKVNNKWLNGYMAKLLNCFYVKKFIDCTELLFETEYSRLSNTVTI
jgi:hypothetical protein